MIQAIQNILSVKELRNKIFFILAILVIYRLAANIPVPGVDVIQLKRFFDENALMGLLNVFFGFTRVLSLFFFLLGDCSSHLTVDLC